jgi:hypothetical protein
MADDIDRMIDEAERAGRRSVADEPRAKSARYDSTSGRILVDLSNGCSFAFPARLAQGLESATEEELACVEVLGAGYGLHWEGLDVDLSVPGLLAGMFGTKAYMDRLRASRAGRATSPGKAAAARVNGAFAAYSARRSLPPISPITPRRKASTQMTKMAPWVTVTHWPNCAR